MHIINWLVQEINGRPLNLNTLKLLLDLLHADLLRLAILRDGVRDWIIVNRVEDLLRDVDDTIAAVPVHMTMHGRSVA